MNSSLHFTSLCLIVFLVCNGFTSLSAQDQHREVTTMVLDSTTVEVRNIASHLRIPWDMEWGPEGNIWFSERDGGIFRVNPESGDLNRLIKIEEVFESEDNSGLHSLLLHESFPEVPYVYAHYTFALKWSRVSRLVYDPTADLLLQDSIVLDSLIGHDSHNGSRMAWGEDHCIYMAIGEGYQTRTAQDTFSSGGKILRFKEDGSVPEDNPFPNSLAYSLGHRNPQGLTFGPKGQLYASEHGPSNDDELNRILKGRNYGWPKVNGYCDQRSEQKRCEKWNVVEPLVSWTPTQAPTGLAWYDHEAIPEWKGCLLQAFVKGTPPVYLGIRIKALRLNEDGDRVQSEQDYFHKSFGRIRDVLVAPDGRVFVCTGNKLPICNCEDFTDEVDDRIIEIRGVSSSPDHP